MTNCSNSFQSLLHPNPNPSLHRPQTHRPSPLPYSLKSHQFLPSFHNTPPSFPSPRPKHERTLSKPTLNKSIPQFPSQPQLTKQPIPYRTDQQDIPPPQKQKTYKNINKSNRAIRPSIPKKIQNNLSSIALHKVRLLPQPNTHNSKSNNKQSTPRDHSTETKKYPHFPSTSTSTSQTSMIQTKPPPRPFHHHQSANNLATPHLGDYKIAESKILFQSQTDVNPPPPAPFKIEESMIDERDPLVNFTILKDLETNPDYTEQIAIERNIGICISLKRVPSQHIHLVSIQKTVYQILTHPTHDHPNILQTYQQLLNSISSQYIFIRQHYDSLLKYELLTKQEFKRYFRNILLIFQELAEKGVEYVGEVYENLVVARNVCKLMNFQKCKIGGAEKELRGRYKVMARDMIDVMVNQVETDLLKEKEFVEFVRDFERCCDFVQVLTHQYLISQGAMYLV